jgi:hypothetical protein
MTITLTNPHAPNKTDNYHQMSIALVRGRTKLRVVGLITRSVHHPHRRPSRLRHARRVVRWLGRGTVGVARHHACAGAARVLT